MLIEKQGGRRGSTSVPINQPHNLLVAHDAGPSQPLTPANKALEVYSDLIEEKNNRKHVVSFDDIRDVANRVADAFEVLGMSQVSDPNAYRHSQRLARLVGLARRKTTPMSPKNSNTKCSLGSQVSITNDDPMWGNTCKCDYSTIQGRQEVVIIHLSSDLE